MCVGNASQILDRQPCKANYSEFKPEQEIKLNCDISSSDFAHQQESQQNCI